jgi:dihydroorotate dehydrogenase (NAD+) catalytic subunit
LSPNVTDIVEMARVAEAAGSDALSLINTFVGLAVDIETRKPILGGVTGGLSGPAIKPVALRMVWEVCKNVDVPVIGMGGIATAGDAIEFLITGATAVAVGTATFYHPNAAAAISDGIVEYMEAHEIDDIADLIGSLRC